MSEFNVGSVGCMVCDAWVNRRLTVPACRVIPHPRHRHSGTELRGSCSQRSEQMIATAIARHSSNGSWFPCRFPWARGQDLAEGGFRGLRGVVERRGICPGGSSDKVARSVNKPHV